MNVVRASLMGFIALLAQGASAAEVSGHYQMDDRHGALLTACDGTIYSVSDENANTVLEEFYQHADIAPGQKLFLKVDAIIDERDSIPLLTINRVVELSTTEKCDRVISDASLENTTWTLTTIGYFDVEDSNASLTLHPDDKRASGSTGCNRYNSNYALAGAELRFTPGAMTRMACLRDTTREHEFMEALSRVTQWKIVGSHLVLRDADGKTVLEFSAE